MRKQKVLVAEDDEELRRGHAAMLAGEGYQVLEASTCDDALRLARAEGPDLILLDAALPDGEGVEVCRKIKAHEGLRDSFVVMLSGMDTTAEHQAEALYAGADGYLAKPVEPASLKANVLAFLRIRQNEEELRASERRYREQAEELRAANQRLEEYNRLKAEFVANMSHELRTPLTAIIGFAQLAQLTAGRDGEMPKRYADAFERILRNGQHLLALINDVLDVSKIEAGRMKIHREHVDLVEVVQGAFAELQSLAERKGLEYRLRVPDRLPLAYTDPLRVRQVVINLLSNAAKFTARGRVEAELRAHGREHFRILVRDTGIGIEERSLPIIFERFRQVDGSMTRSASGVGLGLSIVRQIVDLLGGEIEVTSRVGEGSTFTVTLPLSAPAAGEAGDGEETPQFAGRSEGSAAAGEQGAREVESDDGRPLVVVIEDDEDAAALLRGTLERAGYRVLAAASGAEGLRLAREHDPVAVTLDVMMPEMDGWRVLQAMRADPRLASIPVIVCSIVDNRPLGYSLGASDYILKPVDPQTLTDTLDRVSVRGGPDGEAGGGEGYVLVVDDEHGVRELMTTALRHAGFNARSAPSGETALKMVGQQRPRAVLCDLMMPNGMSGFEFIARLRSDPETAGVPVIVVTGRDVTHEDRRLISGEIAEVIRKGELLLSDVASRLRETLEELGVEPTDGEDTVR
ncbi:MAG TPA: response regulator [Pyrinomonadaceae bacterium]|nr:response regulator [Pyrinomonadaceae bacterium]